jgi:hypothetical protein
VPWQWFAPHPEPAALSRLATLSCSGCGLSGSLNASSGLVLPELRTLALADNQLTGSISQLVAPQLQTVKLGGNRLEDQLGGWMAALWPRLESLYLHDNFLQGTLPGGGMLALALALALVLVLALNALLAGALGGG